MPPVSYARPRSVADALHALAEPNAHALGGGTDLLVAMREDLVQVEQIVDLRQLPGAREMDSGMRTVAASAETAVTPSGIQKSQW